MPARSLPQRTPWLHDMEDAYEAGRFSDAADLFDAHKAAGVPISAVLLRSRIFLKRDDPAGAIGLLAARRPASDTQRAETLMLLATAHARMRQFGEADEEFRAAGVLANKCKDAELSAEIAYRRAVRFVQEKRSSEARAEIARARKARSKRLQLNASEAESFLLASESRYEEQARLLIGVLETLDPNSPDHFESRAWAAHTLAVLARELYIPEAVPLAERHLQAGSWPEDFAVNRFQGTKAIAWCHALRGDYFTAFRLLKRSLSFAPGKQWKAMAHADRAYLAQCNGERLWARQELAEAEELAAHVDWEAMRGEESIALLLIAELFAAADPSRAAYYVARFDELGEVRNRMLHFKHDARLKALADYSRGVVEAALGNKKRAIRLLEATEEFFASIHYDWRAGRCALDLYQVTGDPGHLQRAAERLACYSASWLGRRLREYSDRVSGAIRLPPMQQKVFNSICRGLSNAEIAKALGRSEYTIANHVKALLKTFHVPSRSALVAEAIRRGLV